MLNTAFTTRIGKVGSHYNIWKPFTSFLFDHLNYNCPGMIYVFLGTKAKEWEPLITNGQKLFASHPASAVYAKNNVWDSNDLFNKINDLSKQLFKSKFIW
jgi:uracil DNA glycosylase